MKEQGLMDILDKIQQAKVAVYGDFCLDVYWDMLAEGSEISVETGNRAEAVGRHYYSPGGAGNVAANLAALQPAEVWALGVIGADIYGDKLLDLLNEKGITTRNLVRQVDPFDTYAFVKKYLGNNELSRTDFGTQNKRTAETDAQILQSMQMALEQCDALIFNQQVPGSITRPEFISGAQELFSAYPDKIVLVDTRHITRVFRGVYYKTNELELRKLDARSRAPNPKKQALHLSEQTGQTVFVTGGAQGITVAQRGKSSNVPGLTIDGPLDTVGAGDTVVSALALCLAADIDQVEAARFANLAAGVTIQKLRTTGVATGEEILALNKIFYG